MKLLIDFKNHDIPLLVSREPQEVLKAIVESKDNKLVIKDETIYLDEHFKDIKSVTITFD
ncbi:hypothetical protein BTH38_29355 [Bacillus toyonensis]|uniref:hypothetical protein n=1 Tax=Bacillus toyonensis TaxID=155322 RepID=UPI000A19EF7E|nr:hypothetical protein [Bacillus toyonensis]OSM09685.1 hypothetical protein BTH38_29355 [Bacillus toyonensis]